jgi:hypothetical protein
MKSGLTLFRSTLPGTNTYRLEPSTGNFVWENGKIFILNPAFSVSTTKTDVRVPLINTFTFQLWLYHPTEKNSAGENLIYHFAPNSGKDIDSPSELSAGQIFLKEMASALDIFMH